MAIVTQDPTNPASSPAAQLSPENYAFLQQHIYKESGIVIEPGKQYLLEARLAPIAKKESLSTLNDLCALMRATSAGTVRKAVVEAMTTNETLFFRDCAPFDALRQHVLPPIIEERKNGSRKLSFWSAASSTGQEAYSLAMMLLEMGLRDWKIQITGTDLAEPVLERARQGRYLQIEVNRGLPASYLVKYFTRHGLEWQIKDEIRRMVSFERFDLRQSMRSLGPFDVVFCRNVLIYFDVETKKKILGEIRGTLFKGGYLLLGGAETTLNLDDNYQRKTIGQAVLYQVP